jgi:dUTP pyrophosphatase
MIRSVKIVLRDENCMPTKGHEDDAGWDLRSMNEYEVQPNEQVLVDTGINILLPNEAGWIYEAQIRPRSGLALKKGITVTNSPGTIDQSYTGNVGVIIRNTGKEVFKINKYDRIAQMVINRLPLVEFIKVDSLESTTRGDGGFGSTGKN